MSHFGAKLAEILERRKLRASELSRVTGINDAIISRWITGQQLFVSPDDLGQVCVAISPVIRERAELLRAHLLDHLGASGSELLSISIKGMAEKAPAPYQSLPLQLQRDLTVLAREALLDADVRAVVRGLAGMLEPASSESGGDAGGSPHKLVQILQADLARAEALDPAAESPGRRSPVGDVAGKVKARGSKKTTADRGSH